MNIQPQQTLGELVALDYRTAQIFQKYNLDFCCQGNRPLQMVCESAHLTFAEISQELENILNTPKSGTPNFHSWALDWLVDYVQQIHHTYVEQKISEIKPYLNKICQVHGQHHPELWTIKELFEASADELVVHMKKEELILFPFIKKMLQIKENHLSAIRPPFNTVENPIAMMQDDHSAEGERFRKIAELSNNYTPPTDACNTYKITLACLQEFEADLHLHIHLENNLIFPRAIALEKEVFQEK